tara:strand:+ start:161 stop:691 length:531 start_codon:yes stop_codon:yes gene_type:complete
MTSCKLNNWHPLCEKIVNKQINLEFWASYQYDLMSSYFDRSDVGLKNIAKFFRKSSNEEREHAHKLIDYQNKRGGIVKFENIKNCNLNYLKNENKNDVLLSFEKALEMEQIVYKSLLKLHSSGEENKDPQFTDFIESEYLDEQISALNEISIYISQLQRIGENGHGIWNFDNKFIN